MVQGYYAWFCLHEVSSDKLDRVRQDETFGFEIECFGNWRDSAYQCLSFGGMSSRAMLDDQPMEDSPRYKVASWVRGSCLEKSILVDRD